MRNNMRKKTNEKYMFGLKKEDLKKDMLGSKKEHLEKYMLGFDKCDATGVSFTYVSAGKFSSIPWVNFAQSFHRCSWILGWLY